jgi:hypothetical protein
VNVCVESFLDPVFSAEIHPKLEEAKGISMIFEELLRKRQKNEQYIHKTFVKHHLVGF